MRGIHINISKVILLAYFYLALPIFVFFYGWLKPGLAAIFSVFLMASFAYVFRDYKDRKSENVLKLPIEALFIIVALLLSWTLMSGIGGLTWQRDDWHARNALLHDLIDNRWPVVFEDGSGLTYYVCYWMFPAVMGKIMGWNAANVMLVIWTFMGLILVSFLLLNLFKDSECSITISKSVIITLFLILWGGLNVIGQFFVFLKGKGTMSLDSIYGWSAYQYTPNNALMEWVFNQALPAWIGAGLFLHERKKGNVSNYGLITMLILPFSPFAALGLLPLIIADIVKMRGKKLFSVPNIFSVFGVLPVFYSYFFCNSSLRGNGSLPVFGLYRLDNTGFIYNMLVLVFFLAVEVGMYIFLIWKANEQDYLFVTNTIWLLIIPIIRIGVSDKRMFLMRGSIIPLFVLMVYVIKTMFNEDYRKNKLVFAALILGVCIGFYSGIGDFVLTGINTMNPEITNVADRVKSMNNTGDEAWNAYTKEASYVVLNAKDTFFFGKMGR